MTTVTLASLVSVAGGGTPRRADPAFFGGDVPWVTPKDMKTRFISGSKMTLTAEGVAASPAKLIPTGSVLVVVRSGVLKHTLPVAITQVPVTVNQDMKALIPGPRLDARYLAHLLSARSAEILGWVRATTADNFPIGNLLAMELDLPQIEEQRRIAVILDHAEALRSRCDARLSAMDALDGSIVSRALHTANTRQLHLAEIVDPDDRINYGVVQPGDHVPTGIPLIRVGDLRLGRVDRVGLKRIAPAIDAKHGRSRIRGTEILLSCVGTTGTVALAGPEDVGSNVARAVTRIPISDPESRIFVAAVLKTPEVQRYFSNELRTVSQPTLNGKQIGETQVRIPSEDVVREAVAQLQAASELRNLFQRDLEVLTNLRTSLLARAFSGRL